ncbi:Arc family DNA-binding protein [Dechloromonas denitrificans]|uniref:Arc family DNA-binding protein n=1 Tax=Dechloromonas denitrificans TaxID=281362 RepID=UPI001CF7F601|nr:Arc family DNA-binding protein [Dechloromonas denitrificans]UCV02320.1 Arc family DNA-binding protein [Dechloromonas denitrificans]
MPTIKPDTVNFTLRLNGDLRDWIAHRAVDNHRSINAEILVRLDESRRLEEQKKEPNHD